MRYHTNDHTVQSILEKGKCHCCRRLYSHENPRKQIHLKGSLLHLHSKYNGSVCHSDWPVNATQLLEGQEIRVDIFISEMTD